MKNVFFALVVVVSMIACGNDNNVATADKQSMIEPDPIKRGMMSLDAVYAAERAFMQEGVEGVQAINRGMINALSMWPDTTSPDDRINACHGALAMAARHWINVQAGKYLPMPTEASDLRDLCRIGVDYQYDEARILATWRSLLR